MTKDLIPLLKDLDNYNLHRIVVDMLYEYDSRYVLDIITLYNYTKYTDEIAVCLSLYKKYFKLLRNSDIICCVQIFDIISQKYDTPYVTENHKCIKMKLSEDSGYYIHKLKNNIVVTIPVTKCDGYYNKKWNDYFKSLEDNIPCTNKVCMVNSR